MVISIGARALARSPAGRFAGCTRLAGRSITPAAANCSSSGRHEWTRSWPLGAFHGRFSQIVRASSHRLSLPKRSVVHRIRSRSPDVNCRSPTQNGGSHRPAEVYHPDLTIDHRPRLVNRLCLNQAQLLTHPPRFGRVPAAFLLGASDYALRPPELCPTTRLLPLLPPTGIGASYRSTSLARRSSCDPGGRCSGLGRQCLSTVSWTFDAHRSRSAAMRAREFLVAPLCVVAGRSQDVVDSQAGDAYILWSQTPGGRHGRFLKSTLVVGRLERSERSWLGRRCSE